MDKITVTKAQLVEALSNWEALNREGGCISAEEKSKKSAAEVAAESGDFLWGVLETVVAR